MNTTPVITEVTIEPDEFFKGAINVSAVWAGVDRPVSMSFSLTNMKTAVRLAAAIGAGAVFVNPHVATDVNGQTYVTWDRSTVMAKYANADLRKLGF